MFRSSKRVVYRSPRASKPTSCMSIRTERESRNCTKSTSPFCFTESALPARCMSSSKGHVGIAMSGSEMVDASSGEGCVVRRSYKTDYWRKYFYCAYRIF